MNKITDFIKNQLFKTVISSLIVIFLPFEIPLLSLSVIIMIDTVLGSFHAIKIKNFSSNGFKKFVKKILTYFASIVTVRLAETGVSSIVNTTAATQLLISFLIITESISILENLSLLGFPLPGGFVKIIISNIKNQDLKELLKNSRIKQEYRQNVITLMNSHIAALKSKKLKKLLIIMSEEWSVTVSTMEMQLGDMEVEDHNLIYYKLSSMINVTNNMVFERWKEFRPGKGCLDTITQLYDGRMEHFLGRLKRICSRDIPIERKKRMLIENTIIVLYRIVEDILKDENNLIKHNCR